VQGGARHLQGRAFMSATVFQGTLTDPNKQGNPMGHMQMQNQGGNQEVRGLLCL